MYVILIPRGENNETVEAWNKIPHCPYGVCVVSSYDDTSGKYIMRIWNSSETFYASQEEIEKKCLTNR